MGIIGRPEPVKLISGLLAPDIETLESLYSELEAIWGKIDYKSTIFPFTQTKYYEKEMGANLLRQWIGFEEPFKPENLADVKIKSNEIEENRLRETRGRSVNIDPGYVTLHSLILASTKNFSHRIYLRDGIFAEVTLIYHKENFETLPWTFPDHIDHKEVFMEIRNLWVKQRKKLI